MSHCPDLVEVVEQAERRSAVLIPIDAHHGFGGSRQGVLEVAPPRIVIAATHSARWCHHLVWYNHHHAFTHRTKGLEVINNIFRHCCCQATDSAPGCFSPNFKNSAQLLCHAIVQAQSILSYIPIQLHFSFSEWSFRCLNIKLTCTDMASIRH